MAYNTPLLFEKTCVFCCAFITKLNSCLHYNLLHNSDDMRPIFSLCENIDNRIFYVWKSK